MAVSPIVTRAPIHSQVPQHAQPAQLVTPAPPAQCLWLVSLAKKLVHGAARAVLAARSVQTQLRRHPALAIKSKLTRLAARLALPVKLAVEVPHQAPVLLASPQNSVLTLVVPPQRWSLLQASSSRQLAPPTPILSAPTNKSAKSVLLENRAQTPAPRAIVVCQSRPT